MKVFVVFCIALIFSSCAIINPKNAGLVELGDSPLGMCHAGSTKTDEEYQLLDDIGVQWLRVDYRWDKIEKLPGNLNYSSMDEYTELAVRNNRKILAVLCYDTPWIHADNKRHFYIPPEKHDAFINFVCQTVTRYKDKVAVFEIWNEPNNKIRSFWDGPDNEFFELVKKTVSAIKKIDDNIVVVAPGLFRGDYKYLQEMFFSGALKQADVVSFHPYGMTLSGYLKQIRKIEKVKQENGFNGELWITEMGYPTGGLYPWRVSEKKFPSRIIKSLVYGLSNNIQTIIWYELFDSWNQKWYNSENFFGLIKRTNGYVYKKGAFAFRAIANSISTSRLMNDKVKCMTGNIQYYYFEKLNGDGLLVAWRNGNRRKTHFCIPASECSQWSISSSDIQTYPQGSFTMNVGREPVVLTFKNNEGISEYIKIE